MGIHGEWQKRNDFLTIRECHFPNGKGNEQRCCYLQCKVTNWSVSHTRASEKWFEQHRQLEASFLIFLTLGSIKQCNTHVGPGWVHNTPTVVIKDLTLVLWGWVGHDTTPVPPKSHFSAVLLATISFLRNSISTSPLPLSRQELTTPFQFFLNGTDKWLRTITSTHTHVRKHVRTLK